MSNKKTYHRIDEGKDGRPVANRYPVVKEGKYGDYVVHTVPNQTAVAPSSEMSCARKKNGGHPVGGFAGTQCEAWEKYYRKSLLKLISLEARVGQLKENLALAIHHQYAKER